MRDLIPSTLTWWDPCPPLSRVLLSPNLCEQIHSLARGHSAPGHHGTHGCADFVSGWVARFGTPSNITTDHGTPLNSCACLEPPVYGPQPTTLLPTGLYRTVESWSEFHTMHSVGWDPATGAPGPPFKSEGGSTQHHHRVGIRYHTTPTRSVF